MKIPLTIDGKQYDMDLGRTHNLVIAFESLVTSCEHREMLERAGEWTPEDEDVFGELISECRKLLGCKL